MKLEDRDLAINRLCAWGRKNCGDVRQSWRSGWKTASTTLVCLMDGHTHELMFEWSLGKLAPETATVVGHPSLVHTLEWDDTKLKPIRGFMENRPVILGCLDAMMFDCESLMEWSTEPLRVLDWRGILVGDWMPWGWLRLPDEIGYSTPTTTMFLHTEIGDSVPDIDTLASLSGGAMPRRHLDAVTRAGVRRTYAHLITREISKLVDAGQIEARAFPKA